MNFHNQTASGNGQTPVECAPIELASLLHRCMGNVDFAERMLKRFEETFDPQIEELRQQACTDREEIARLAHRMKGAAANISAPRLEHVLLELHELVTRTDPANSDEIGAVIADTAAAWITTRQFLATADFSEATA